MREVGCWNNNAVTRAEEQPPIDAGEVQAKATVRSGQELRAEVPSSRRSNRSKRAGAKLCYC
jgi:hypothetical protein